MNECRTCANKIDNSWTHHIGCSKPDPNMSGNPHGISHGWFFYPLNFDPCWKEKACANYEEFKPKVTNELL